MFSQKPMNGLEVGSITLSETKAIVTLWKTRSRVVSYISAGAYDTNLLSLDDAFSNLLDNHKS